MEEIKTQMLNETDIVRAVKIVRDGGTVAIRTETVWGIAANIRNSNKIFAAKKRDENRNFVMQFATLEKAIVYFGDNIGEIERKIFSKFKTGLTIVLPKNNIAIRIPDDPIAIKFLSHFDEPILVTSANISGMPAATTWQQVHQHLRGRIDAIVMSSPCKIGTASTIIKMIGNEVDVIRSGCVDATLIQKFVDSGFKTK